MVGWLRTCGEDGGTGEQERWVVQDEGEGRARVVAREVATGAGKGLASTPRPDRPPPHMPPTQGCAVKGGRRVGGAFGAAGWARGARGCGAVRSRAPSGAQAAMRKRVASAPGGSRGGHGKGRAVGVQAPTSCGSRFGCFVSRTNQRAWCSFGTRVTVFTSQKSYLETYSVTANNGRGRWGLMSSTLLNAEESCRSPR